MGFADRVAAGIRSGAVDGGTHRDRGGIATPATHKIMENDPRYIRGFFAISSPDLITGLATVTAKASGGLIGTIARDGANHIGTLHNGTIVRGRRQVDILIGLADAQNTHIDTLRSAR